MCAVVGPVWSAEGDGPWLGLSASRVARRFPAHDSRQIIDPDLCLIAERTLTEYEHRLFRYYHLLGADWKLCTRRFNLDRGQFFHFIYRMEEKLGRAFVETEPYALFPLDNYFGGSMRTVQTRAIVSDPAAEREALRIPMLLSA